MKLNVFFGNKKAGSLESTENRGVIFIYDENYLNDKTSVPLSASLPLQREEFPQKQCIPFFSELENGKETLQMNKVLHCLEMLGINLYAVNREDDTGENK